MRAFVLYLLLALTAPACSLPASEPASGDNLSAELYYVEKVIDGDTFIIEGGEKVRLIGIDAPETPNSFKQRNFHYGIEAKDHLRELIGSQKLKLEFDIEKRDQYDRLLAYAWLENGLFINAYLIEEGYARVVTFPPNVKYHDQLNQLESEAKENKRGLWNK
ncbi:micrococcal nuclease [Anseongella ginsenosidimutans]|uniref:Micrococcal nuclease n=1 Tax=Anseongella ginsenosidimutans TaxID=496056 RepID=A0A4R3KT65_9SPHI|nr:thermonuclease family protein [Anseongella ginsenosidimutans]QEC53172.1 thermonuclease family protein [Anseongella ginsenosidimutans]TCS87799.1 micrococcal nuclease [Anseongella ginsenosidimutans]